MEDYNKILRSPQWQKRRLEILSRDNFTCQICGHKDKELHVHHLAYSAKNPCLEDGKNLITLCTDCHKAEHEAKRNILDTIYSLCNDGSTMLEIEALLYEYSLALHFNKTKEMFHSIIGDPTPEHGEQDYWGIDDPAWPIKRISEWRARINK